MPSITKTSDAEVIGGGVVPWTAGASRVIRPSITDVANLTPGEVEDQGDVYDETIVTTLRGYGPPTRVAAPLGCVYEDATNGEVWYKSGLDDTEWSRFGDVARSTTISVPAVEEITAYTVVTATGVMADSADVTHRNIIAGIASESFIAGISGAVVTSGYIVNTGWSWTKGDVIYLNGTSLSVTPPTTGFRVVIGTALSATELCVKISESILL